MACSSRSLGEPGCSYPRMRPAIAEPDLGCEHYRRRCQLVCPQQDCNKVYTCRICHDDKESHLLDRYNVKKIICSVCNLKQNVSNRCGRCGCSFGEYFCQLCNLFGKFEYQYHCLDCGLCRVGPQDNYFHCTKCGICLSIDLLGNHKFCFCCKPLDQHKCVEHASDGDCPVCTEDLHHSRCMSRVLPCGHLIHKTCLEDLLGKDHKDCPVCREPIPLSKYVVKEPEVKH